MEKDVLRDFVRMCQQSLPPDEYEAAMRVCQALCDTRHKLGHNALEDVLNGLLAL